QHSRQVAQLLGRGVQEAGTMMARDDPEVERRERGIGDERAEERARCHQARLLALLLLPHPADHALALVIIVVAGLPYPRTDTVGYHRQAKQLHMRMEQRGAGRYAMVLKVDRVLDARIVLEDSTAYLKGVQRQLDLFESLSCRRGVVQPRLDHDLVVAD